MLRNILFFVFFISAQDGIISSEELNKAKELLANFYKNLGLTESLDEEFDEILKEFFKSEAQFDDYFAAIQKQDLELILHIARLVATADGFEIRENIAFDRALKSAGFSYDDLERWEKLYN